MKEAVIINYNDFKTQHKKMYPTHSEEQIKAAWERYSAAHNKKEEEKELEEVASPQKKADMKRVNAGVMSRDEYNKKWKLGKYASGKRSLSGPGGLYKNLVKREEIETLEEMRELYAVVDTTDGTVVATASSEESAKRSMRTAHLPPISSEHPSKLKVVKTKKVARVGYPLEEAATEYSLSAVLKKIKDGEWESSTDVKPGKHVEISNTSTGKKWTIYVKEEVELKEKIDIEALLDAALAVRKKNPQLRKGQSIMIALRDMDKKAYDIAKNKADVFNNDSKIPQLIQILDPSYYNEEKNLKESPSLETLRLMKIVSLVTGSRDLDAIYEFALTSPQYSSLVELKETFNKYIQNA